MQKLALGKNTFDVSPLLLAHKLGYLMAYQHPLGQNTTHFPYFNPYQDSAGGVIGKSEAYKLVESNLPKLAVIFE